MITWLKILFKWVMGAEDESCYYYGKIIGFDNTKARKHKITGKTEFESKCADENGHWVEFWTEVKPEYKTLFWHYDS